MADLHVQPKKRTSILPWLLLGLGVLALLIWLFTRNKDTDDVATNTNNTVVTSADSNRNEVTNTTTASTGWTDVNFDAPSVNYEEVTNKNINVRGTGNYGIYGVGEDVLFDEGKATIRSDAASNLKQIAGSIGKRYNGGEVRVYGFTDAQGSTGANKELAQQRADAVKAWLQNNGIDAGRISVNAIGEAQPVATNNTEEGRQQNRRVEIVARTTSNNTAQ